MKKVFIVIILIILSVVMISALLSLLHQKANIKSAVVINISNSDRNKILEIIEKLEFMSPKLISIFASFPLKNNDSTFYKIAYKKYNNIVTLINYDTTIKDIKYYKSIYPYLNSHNYGFFFTNMKKYNADLFSFDNYKYIEDEKFYNLIYLQCLRFDSTYFYNKITDKDELYLEGKEFKVPEINIYEIEELNSEFIYSNIQGNLVFMADLDSIKGKKKLNEEEFITLFLMSKTAEIMNLEFLNE